MESLVITLRDGTVQYVDPKLRVSEEAGHEFHGNQWKGGAAAGVGLKTMRASDFPKNLRDGSEPGFQIFDDVKTIHPDAIAGMKAGLEDLRADNLKLYGIVHDKFSLAAVNYEPAGAAMTTITGNGVSTLLINGRFNAAEISKGDDPRWSIVSQVTGKGVVGAGGESSSIKEAYRLSFLHEVGHVADREAKHELTNRVIDTLSEKFNGSGGKITGWIRDNLSVYAASSPEETVGEAFSKIYAGQKLPKELSFIEDYAHHNTLRKLEADARNLTAGDTEFERWRDTKATDWIRLDELRAAGGEGSGNFGHAGRPGEVGGSSTDGGAGKEAWKSSGGFEHTGITWKQPTDPKTGRAIPIKVASVEEAIPLVLAGKVVEVADVQTAHTIITKLADMAAEAKAAGKEAKDYDLCNVSVAGSNMFCGDTLRTKEHPNGLSRLEMPQLGGEPVPGSEADKLPRNVWDQGEVDGSQQFISYLQGIGVRTSEETIPAANLMASQRELVGSKVGAMMRDTSFDPGKNPIFISSDNYIVDGHHRWAAVIGRDAADGRLGDSMMTARRVNAPISEVLHLANAWSEKFGIQQAAGVTAQDKATGLRR